MPYKNLNCFSIANFCLYRTLISLPVVTIDVVDDDGSCCTVVTPLSPKAMAIKSSLVTY